MNNRKLKQLVKEALSNMIDEVDVDDLANKNYGGAMSETEGVPDHNFKNQTGKTTARDFKNKATDISDDYNDITSVGLEEDDMGGGAESRDAELLADLIDSDDMGGEEEIFPLHEFFGMDEMAKSANVYRLKPGKEAALIRLLKMTNQKLKDRTRDTGGRGNKPKSFTDDDLERIIDVISQGEFTTNDLRAAHQNTDPNLGRKKGSGPQMWNNILNKQPKMDDEGNDIPGTGGLMSFGKTGDNASGYIELTSQLKKSMEPDTSAEPKRRGRPAAPKPEDEFDTPEMEPEMAPDSDPVVQQATQAQAQEQDPKKQAVKSFMDQMKAMGVISDTNKVLDMDTYKDEFAKFKSTMNEAANTDLELKSFTKQLYSYAKKEGAQAFLVDFTKMSPKQLGGKVPDTNKPSVFIQISNGEVAAKMVGNGVDQLYKDMVNSYPKFEFGEYKYSDKQAFPPYEGVIPMVTFTVKSKTTGKKGGVMATESLNENKNKTMKKGLLTERFQQLAGIKPIYAINSLNEAKEIDMAKSFLENKGLKVEIVKSGNEGHDKASKFAGISNPEADKTAYIWGGQGNEFYVYIPFKKEIAEEMKKKFPVKNIGGKSGTYYEIAIENK